MSGWSVYEKESFKKTLPDEIHEFLTKVYNVYFIQLPPSLMKSFETVRDKLIPLTVRIEDEKYRDFCTTFSQIYRSVMVDSSIPQNVKEIVKELAEKTNKFFQSRGFPLCVTELKYYRVKVKVLYKGKPLGNALVIAETSGKVAASKETDSSGVAELELPNGSYTISVYKQLDEDKYIYEEKTIEISSNTDLKFNIEKTKTYIEISRERGGRPLIKEIK